MEIEALVQSMISMFFIFNGVSWLVSLSTHIIFKKFNSIANFTKDGVITQYTYTLSLTLVSLFLIIFNIA